MLKENLFIKILLYFIGLLLTSFGVVLMLQTNKGVGSWDSVNYSLSVLINTKLGYASMIVNILIVLFVVIYRKNLKFIQSFIPIILSGFLVNLWIDYVFVNFTISTTFLTYLYLILGALVLPVGLSFIIVSTLPKMIFDELTFAWMDIFKSKSFPLIRIGIEIFAVLLGLLLGYFAKIEGLGQIGIGTLIVVFTIGPLIGIFTNILNKVFKFN